MFGRPVIASAIAALQERVQPSVNGFTFPARDARALANLIVSLAGNEPQWLKVNRTIEQPWTELEMLEAHERAWKEVRANQPRLVPDSKLSLEAILIKAADRVVEAGEHKRPRRSKSKRSLAEL